MTKGGGGMQMMKLFRSVWGLEEVLRRNPTQTFKQVQQSGYAGIEASLRDLGSTLEERTQTATAAANENLQLIVSAYSSWPSYIGPFKTVSMERHISTFCREVEEIIEISNRLPHATVIGINGHSGSDAWTDEEGFDFFSRLLEWEDTIKDGWSVPPISHETHRGRFLCCPFVTVRLLQRLPELRLTSDFSHWVVKTERLLDSPEEKTLLTKMIAPAVSHIHARIGTPQSPQIADLNDPRVTRAVTRHYDWWRDIIDSYPTADPSDVITATIEYGPIEVDDSGENIGYTTIIPGRKDVQSICGRTHEEILHVAKTDFLKRLGYSPS